MCFNGWLFQDIFRRFSFLLYNLLVVWFSFVFVCFVLCCCFVVVSCGVFLFDCLRDFLFVLVLVFLSCGQLFIYLPFSVFMGFL